MSQEGIVMPCGCYRPNPLVVHCAEAGTLLATLLQRHKEYEGMFIAGTDEDVKWALNRVDTARAEYRAHYNQSEGDQSHE